MTPFDYMQDEKPTASNNNAQVENLSRRQFFQGLGALTGCLLLGVQLATPAQAASIITPDGADSFEPSVFIRVAADGLVSIISHRSEMGQGIKSSLPLLMADEMEADWKKVEVIQATADEKYGSQNTDGSRSVRKNYHRLRLAGATARTMLQQAAAQLWQVDVTECQVYNHQVHHKASGKTADFAELVAIAAQMPIPAAETVKLKSDDQLRYIGKDDIELVEGKALVTGQAIYGFDVELKDQTYAVIERPPVLFGKVKSYDAKATLKVPGVLKVIPLDSPTAPAHFKPLGGIAVIASNTWAAIKGREKLKIEWDHGANQQYSTDSHKQAFAESLVKPKHQIRQEGNWQSAVKAAKQVLEAEYYCAGQNHAMMEPPAATARFIGDKLEIWTCTQTPQSAKTNVVNILGLKPENVTINVTYLGGGFGRKSKPDYVAEAALLAQKSGLTVKLIWTREDEIRQGYHHSPSLQKLAATIDAKGNTTGWRHQMVMHPIGYTFNPTANRPTFENDLGCADVPYAIDNILIENGETETFQRIGWVRSVANISNVFAAGCFVDEIAHAKNMDAKEHLLSIIGKDRHIDFAKHGYKFSNYGEKAEEYPVDTARLKHVLQLAAQKSNWGKKLPKGHGIGIAAHRSFCSYVATVVEVAMVNGRVKIKRVDSAADCGKMVNPDRVKAQMEGAVYFAASYSLYGEVTLKDGQVEQGNFDDYPLVRINEVEQVHVHMVDSNEKPTGIGEPGVPPFAPALYNAIFNATGKRYRQLPLNQFGIV